MRKIFLTLLCVALSLTALVACGHSHTFEEDWSSDAENHWHAATCEHTEEKDALAAHVDENEDDTCDVCGYHEHTYSNFWSKDAENHWHAATCHTTEKKDVAAHVDADENGECDDCTYEVGHTHTYADTWSSDADKHWYAATCSHTTVKKDEAAHVDANEDGKCDVCEKTGLHTHTYNTDEWESDATGHWHAATCTDKADCATAKNAFAAHADTATVDGLCDVCGYEMYAYITVVNPDEVTNTIPTTAQDIGSEVTFTVTVDSDFVPVITGATQVGDGVVDGDNTTYTYKIAAVDVDTTVTIAVVPFGALDPTNSQYMSAYSGATPGATATQDIWANATDVVATAPTDTTGYTKYTMVWNQGNTTVGPNEDGTAFVISKKITIVSIKNAAGEECTITINEGLDNEMTYAAGQTLDKYAFGGSFWGDESSARIYAVASDTQTDTLVMAFQTTIKINNDGQGCSGNQAVIDFQGIKLSEYLEYGNRRKEPEEGGGLYAYNQSLNSVILYWDGGASLSCGINYDGQTRGYVSLKDGAVLRIELHEHDSDPTKMVLKYFLGDLTTAIGTKEVVAVAVTGLKEASVMDEQSGRVQISQPSDTRYAEIILTDTTFIIYE